MLPSPADNDVLLDAEDDTLRLETVMECLLAHKIYGDTEKPLSLLKNLPDLDDLSIYGISSENAAQMWEHEAIRLRDAANDPSQEFLFEDDTLGNISTSKFGVISKVGQRLLWVLIVCRHDLQLALLENQKDMFEQDRFSSLNRYLERRLDHSDAMEALKLDDSILRACHAAINSITAILARLVVQAVDNSFWHPRTIAAWPR